MKRSNMATQMENLKAFVSVRDAIASQGGNYFSVTFQLTFMEGNLAELPELVRIAIDIGCDRVKGHHL
jgi:hypothetical protein